MPVIPRVYGQEVNYYEDGVGKRRLIFVVANLQEYIFTQTPKWVNLFDITETIEELEQKTGVLAEDEMSLELNEAKILSADDQDARDFILDAQDKSIKRYVGLFECAVGEGIAVDNNAFLGVILPDMKAMDLHWHNDEYTDVPNPLRKWQLTAQPFFENAFDLYELDELINGIDSTWEAANVADRQGHFYADALKNSRFGDLVNLNKLMKKLSDILIDKLAADEYGTFNIDYLITDIDGKFRPTRFPHPARKGVIGPWIQYRDENDNDIPEHYWQFPADDTSIKTLKLGDYESAETVQVSPYIDYKCLKLDADHEYSPSQAKSFLWTSSKAKSFTDLIYMIAREFGMFVKIYYVAENDIRIEFISRKNFLGTHCFIKGPNQADVQTSAIKSEEVQFYGDATYLADEGGHGYSSMSDGSIKPYSYFSQKSRQGERQLFTLSPTWFATANNLFPDSGYLSYLLPHNSIFYMGGSPNYLRVYSAPGLHTGLYMTVSPYGTADGEPISSYFTPAGIWTVNINGEQVDFHTKTEYLNYLYARDKNYYETEYTIKLPYINGFSASSDGANPSWQNIKLGSRITLDGKEYTVMSIRRNWAEMSTEIKLHNVSRFNFLEPDIIEDVNSDSSPELPTAANDNPVTLTQGYIANEDIAANNVVSIRSDGTIERSLPIAGHYKRIFGVITQSVVAGQPVDVVKIGEAYLSGAGLTPGLRLFLRDTGGSSNISQTPLTEITGDEALFASVGLALSGSYVEIDFTQQFILQ